MPPAFPPSRLSLPFFLSLNPPTSLTGTPAASHACTAAMTRSVRRWSEVSIVPSTSVATSEMGAGGEGEAAVAAGGGESRGERGVPGRVVGWARGRAAPREAMCGGRVEGGRNWEEAGETSRK